MTIKFGTDGWRAVISEEFTFENVRRVAQAIADKTLADSASAPRSHLRPSLVVGYDTRFLSDRYAAAVAEVFAANDIHVWLARSDAPTPLISYAIVHKSGTSNIMGGVMITASHNPPRYNGIKLKAAYGGSAREEDTRAVVAQLEQRGDDSPKRLPLGEAIDRGLVQKFDPLPAYRQHIRTLVDFDAIRKRQAARGRRCHVRGRARLPALAARRGRRTGDGAARRDEPRLQRRPSRTD